jgi:RNA polymerase sigma factor (sigma-70 family)
MNEENPVLSNRIFLFSLAMTENLIQHCLENRRGADEALFRHCFSFLWPTCRTYSQDDQEAMHYLNAGFYKILKGLQKWNQTIPFQNWAKRVVINAIIDDKRKTLKYNNHETILDQIPIKTAESEVTGRFLDEECEYLLSIIRSLPKTTSLVFSLFAVNEFTYEEIAGKLGISETTVRWHIADARKKIIVKLAQSKTTSYGNAR